VNARPPFEIATVLGVIISLWIAWRIPSWVSLSLKDQFDLLVGRLNAIAIISISQTAARRPERITREFFDALLNSKPITPRHEPLTAVAEGWDLLVRDKDRQFFEDFWDFAEVINSWLADKHVGSSWRLQELPDAELRRASSDMPYFGSAIPSFHNQVGIGALELSPGSDCSTEQPNIVTRIKLDWVRLVRYDEIVGFLTTTQGRPERRHVEVYWC
jgi:hypothetical protein